MATYAQLSDLTGYINQLRDEDASNPEVEVLAACLNRAEGFVNTYLGLTESLTPAAVDTRTLYGDGSLSLSSDIPMSAVTLVEAPAGYSVPEYIEYEGALRIADSSGVMARAWYPALGSGSWGYSTVWQDRVPYEVTATFGSTASDMAILAECTLQIAVQLWRYKDAGGSETIGSEGAITTVRAGLTPLVRQALDAIRRRMRGNSIGVY